MEIMHFNSQKERLAYLRGGFEEIVPIEAKIKPVNEEKPQKEDKKGQKKTKKVKKNEKVQAE